MRGLTLIFVPFAAGSGAPHPRKHYPGPRGSQSEPVSGVQARELPSRGDWKGGWQGRWSVQPRREEEPGSALTSVPHTAQRACVEPAAARGPIQN